MEKLNELSIFLLAYNEEKNIRSSINNAFEAARENADKFEVLVVLYGGSSDKTKDIVLEMAKENNSLKLVIQPIEQKGYGAGLRVGIENSKYKYIFYTDADNQFDIREISKLIPYLERYDIVSGYRKKRNDEFMRIVAARVYNVLLGTLFFHFFRDVDSAFKIYKRSIFDKIKITCNTGMADAEIMQKANMLKFKIKEIPVTHYSRKGGKGNFDSGFGLIKFSVVINLLRDMLKVRKNTLMKKFD